MNDATYVLHRRRSKKTTDITMIPRSLIAASIKPFILSLLQNGPSYGYEIIHRIEILTMGDLSWTTSTLYPVLHKLENEGLLDSYWQEVEKGPARKYYRLTPKGVKRLEVERAQWLRIHDALSSLWGPRPALSTT